MIIYNMSVNVSGDGTCYFSFSCWDVLLSWCSMQSSVCGSDTLQQGIYNIYNI